MQSMFDISCMNCEWSRSQGSIIILKGAHLVSYKCLLNTKIAVKVAHI